ncbi:MAG: hypothetical protein JJU33_08990 [Phycisphaerales bacterium]|nr:hypothetical protein [Phycisphaerales bacterium]
MNRTRAVFGVLLIGGAAMLVGTSGCAGTFLREGGAGRSLDQYTYVSRPHSPKTVSLIDTRTDEVIWTVDVPVGHQLSMRFVRNHDRDNAFTPDLLRWEIWEGRRWAGRFTNSMPVPSSDARRVDMTLREGPEFPG